MTPKENKAVRANANSTGSCARRILCHHPGQGSTSAPDGNVYRIPGFGLHPRHRWIMCRPDAVDLRSESCQGIIVRPVPNVGRIQWGLYPHKVLHHPINPLLCEHRVAPRAMFDCGPLQLGTELHQVLRIL